MALTSGVTQQKRPQPTTAPLGGPVPLGGGLQPPAGGSQGRGGLSSLGPQFAFGGANQGQPIAPVTPSPVPQGPPPALTGVESNTLSPTQQFGPGNNLISTQFNPNPSSRLQGTQGQADTARGNIAGFQPGQFEGIGTGTFGSGADTAAARAGISQDLGAIRGGPSRGELAQQTFQQLRESGEPQFQADLRDVGRRAASLGRIGAGLTTSQLGDVISNRERDLGLAQRGLATQAAGQEIGDRFNTLGASQGVAGQLFGQDIGQAGFQQGLRGEQRGERFAGQDFGFRNLAAQQGIAGQLAGFEGQQFGQEQSQRNELRGERGFQTALDQQNIQNRVQQRQLEEALLSGQFGRDFSRQQLFADIGFGGGSQGNFGNQSGRFAQNFGNQANASNQSAAGLFGSLFNQGGGQGQQFPQPIGSTNLGGFTERRAPDFNPRR